MMGDELKVKIYSECWRFQAEFKNDSTTEKSTNEMKSIDLTKILSLRSLKLQFLKY